MKRKLKLKDKIRKFFGQEGLGKQASESTAVGTPPASERSGEESPSRNISAVTQSHAAEWSSGSEAKVRCSAPATNLASAKADLSSNPKTTGNGCGDLAYALHNEVCFPQLLDTLAAGTPEQRAVAAEALFNLTAESDAARQRATAAGVVAHLTELLMNGTEHARMYAAYTLSSLTSIDEALVQMREQGAPAALVALLAGCPLLVCKKGAMRALGRLARNDEAAAEIVAAGGLRPIVSLLGHSDASLVRRCLVALYFIGADKPELQAELGSVPGAISQLVSLLRSDNADVRAEAADVIKVVSRSPTCGIQIAAAGGLELLAALTSLSSCGGGVPHGAGSSAHARARASAARSLQRLNDMPELRAAMAAQFGEGQAPGHNAAMTAGAGGAAGLIAASAAMRAGPSIGGNSSVRGESSSGGCLVDVATLEEMAEAAEGDDVRELVAAVAKGSAWMRAKAAAAIEQVAVDDPTASKDLAAVGVIDPLLDLLEKGTEAGRKGAARALLRIADDPHVAEKFCSPSIMSRLLRVAPSTPGSGQKVLMAMLQQLLCSERGARVLPGTQSGPLLLRLLETECEPGIHERAARMLAAVCAADDAALGAIVQDGQGFASLLQRLQQGPSDVRNPLLHIVLCLTARRQDQQSLLRSGVVQALLSLFKGGHGPQVTDVVSKALENLSQPASSILERSLSERRFNLATASAAGDGLSSRVAPALSAPGATAAAQRPEPALAPTEAGVPGEGISEAAERHARGTTGAGDSSSAPPQAQQPQHASSAAAGVPANNAAAATAADVPCASPCRGLSGQLQDLSIIEAQQPQQQQPQQQQQQQQPQQPQQQQPQQPQQQQQQQKLPPTRLPAAPSMTQELAQSPVLRRPSSTAVAAAIAAAEHVQVSPVEKPSTPQAHLRTGVVAAVVVAMESSALRPAGASGGGRLAQDKERAASPSRAVAPAAKARPVSGRPSYVAAHVAATAAAAAAAQSPPTTPVRQSTTKKQQQQQQQQPGQLAQAQAQAQINRQPSQPQQQPAQQQPAQQQPAQQQAQQPQQPQQQAPQQVQQQALHHQQQQQPAAVHAAAPPSPSPQKAAASPPAAGAVPAAGGSPAPSPSPAPADVPDGGDAAARGGEAGGASAGGTQPSESDDLLSSTYDNLHGLLMKKTDIRICRTQDGRKLRLGEGGFGVVYKAVMNNVDEVAVKLVKTEKPSRQDLELFLKEVQTLAKLHHRNIVQFYGACLEIGSMFFATELMKGGDLYTALRHHAETMKWERLGRKVALDVALGLNYLHSQRPPMMHRDLKSPNVLLSEEGVAKIADVGMVRSQVKDLVTAQPVMTPLWAAPEVVRHERASIKADIWSYGIILWELVSSEDITTYQPLSISRQMGPNAGGRALALPARCPAIARRIFTACTQMDPEKRPTAHQLVEWLRSPE